MFFCWFFCFFFSSRRRHTRCGRDWSSDVCSSDLHADDDSRDGKNAERRDLSEGDANAKQGDAKTQNGARGKLDAGDAASFFVQKVKGHAEQKSKEHDRRAIMLSQPCRGERDCGGDEKSRIDGVDKFAAR